MPNRQTKTPGIIARRITHAVFVCLPLLHNLPQYQPRYTQQNRASRFLSSCRFIDARIALCYSQGHQPHKKGNKYNFPLPIKGASKKGRGVAAPKPRSYAVTRESIDKRSLCCCTGFFVFGRLSYQGLRSRFVTPHTLTSQSSPSYPTTIPLFAR